MFIRFWAAVAAFVSANGAAFVLGESVIARVVCVIGGVGALCVYMLAEAKADSGNS
ncbi:MAG: hypothetical protein LBD85_01500 [Oscillospiraceae bacterium]|nr:hypothetical protein [Oscillospiraceae bacterium]